jgi:hypothetical protein
VFFSLSFFVLYWGMKMRSITNFFEKYRYLGFQSFFLPFFVFPTTFPNNGNARQTQTFLFDY